MNSRRSMAAWALMVVVVSACSSGVSDEEHEAALDDAARARATLVALEADLAAERRHAEDVAGRTAEQEALLAGVRAELESAQQALDEAHQEVDRLRARGDRSVLRRVLEAGFVRCGIQGSAPGFSLLTTDGEAFGFDVDMCRAIAAATLGDATAVRYVPVTAGERFQALVDDQVDVLVRVTTHTLARSAELGVDFGPTIYHDGHQFLGATSTFAGRGIGSLDGRRVCVVEGSPHHSRSESLATSAGIDLDLVLRPNLFEAVASLADGACDATAGDGSGLAAQRAQALLEGRAPSGGWTIFPSIPLSREPLAPVVREGDPQWKDIVDWVVYTTIIAELNGITSENVESVELPEDVARLFGVTGGSAQALGLGRLAFQDVVRQVGNYGEIFDRNLGSIGLERSLNALYTEGGLLYPPRS